MAQVIRRVFGRPATPSAQERGPARSAAALFLRWRRRLGLSAVQGWLALLLAASATLLQSAEVVTMSAEGVLVLTPPFGDFNEDSEANVLDVVLLTHHVNGIRLLAPESAARGDLNQDSRLEADDVTILSELIVGLRCAAGEDFDRDELPNAAEWVHGTDPLDPDSDADGGLDGWEIAEGTNPLEASSQVAFVFVAAPAVQVVAPGTENVAASDLGALSLAQPPITAVLPGMAEGQEAGAITMATPPIEVTAPGVDDWEGVLLGACALGQPPVQVTLPVPTDPADDGAITLAGPVVEVVLPGLPVDPEPGGLTVARPAVEVAAPGTEDADFAGRGAMTVGQPAVEVTVPALADPAEEGALTVARPGIAVTLPGTLANEEASGLTLASPPVVVVLPGVHAEEDGGGVRLAQPPVGIVSPGVQDLDLLNLGRLILGHPPVEVEMATD